MISVIVFPIPAAFLCHMYVIFFLIACSIVIGLVFLIAFVWSVKSGQYDDVHTPAVRVLFEDEKQAETEEIVD